MKNKGFSLVELIVVIAIMAILVGVAVPVYSSYVEKAQKASDIQMVDEIKHALQVYYASNPTDFEGGYIVLKPDGSFVSDTLETVIEQTFGGTELTLSYAGWNGSQVNGLWNLVGQYQDADVSTALNSDFMEIPAEGMMGAVGDLLEIAAGSISNNKAGTLSTLSSIGVNNAVLNDLAADNDISDDEFNVAVSNVLVGFYADKINSGDSTDDPLVNLLNVYVNAYAYGQKTGDTAYFDAVQGAIQSAEAGTLIPGEEGLSALMELGDPNYYWGDAVGDTLYDAYGDAIYIATEDNKEAMEILMGAVGQVAGSHNNADDLLNGNLYREGSVANQIDTYKNALKIKAALGGAFPEMGANDVIVLMLADGTVFSSIDE